MDSFQNNIIYSHLLSPLDWVVFLFVILLTLFAVVMGHKLKPVGPNNKKGMLELLLMGRQLTLPLFVATLVATWYGGIFGVTKISYEYGLYNFIISGVFWYATYLLFAFFMVDKIGQFKAVTLPDLIGQMFGPKSGYISGVFNFFNVVPIVYTISLGLLLQTLFGGNLFLMTAIGVLIVLSYSVFGGFRAVVFSDLVQFFVMCLSVFLVIGFSLSTFGGLDFLREKLPTGHFSLTGGESIAKMLVWGLIALSTLVDPNFYQRCFAAKTPQVAKKGILISTGIWILFDLCTTFGGMYARAVLPESSSNQAYLVYALQLLPDGLRGFFLAGIMATILSTMDSYIFLAGTTLTHDLLPKRFQDSKKAHYLGVISVGILALIMAQVFQGDIKDVWKTLGSFSSACLLFPVMMGFIFPKRISDRNFFLSCTFSLIGTAYWRLVEHEGFLAEVDELYIGVLISFFTLLSLSLYEKRKFKQ